MAGVYDATLKQLFDAYSPALIAYLAPFVGLPASVVGDPLDPDLSVIQPVADKVFRLRSPASGLLHVEPQSSWDGEFPNRLLLYNVLLEDRYGGPVHTIAMLLRREANSSTLTGTIIRRRADGQEYLKFSYAIVKLWELPLATLMDAGLGLTPLALLTDEATPRLQQVVNQFEERVEREAATSEEANLILNYGFLLLGLRYDEAVIRSLFHGVQKMRESSTYQSILNEGRTEGIIIGEQQSLLAVLKSRFGAIPPELENKIRATTDSTRLQTALQTIYQLSKPEDLGL